MRIIQKATAIGTFLLSLNAFGQNFIGTIDDKVAYDTNYVYSRDGIKCLHLGGSLTNGGEWPETHGIDCLATNVDMNGIDQLTPSYGFFAVQTILDSTHTLTKADGSTVTTNETGLDGAYPTQEMGDANGTTFYDYPGVGYTSSYLTNFVQFSVTNSFRTVLMFQCFECQPVPIREVYWNWSGVVALTNGEWTLVSSNATITVNNRDTLQYPVWTNVVEAHP